MGGIFSTVFPPLATTILQATLILHALIVELHRLTTNCSSARKSNSNVCEGHLMEDTFAKVGVISGKK